MANYDDIVISSGHGKFVSGANRFINEVAEARRVVEQVADYFRQMGDEVDVFHDDTSKTQNQNLTTIIRFHNSKGRQIDVSIHFNAGGGEGVEVLYYDALALAQEVSAAIAQAGGFRNRGAKVRKELAFLNGTNKPAILIEVCFVDSQSDVQKYHANFLTICKAIAETISGEKIPEPFPQPAVVAPTTPIRHVKIVNVNAAAIMMDKPDRINGSNIDTIPKNTIVDMIVPVDGYNNGTTGYFKIVYGGKTGYINAKYGQEV